MTVTYDPTDLDTSTPEGRVNVVRLLVGDTEVLTAELQDEEITFSLGQSQDKVYYAASYCASILASRYADFVDTELDEALSADYSNLFDKYRNLSTQLLNDAKRLDGSSLGIFIGGIPSNTETSYAFYRGQFQHPCG